MTQPALFDGLDHDGETYDRELDGARLNAQTQRVYDRLIDCQWHTLRELSSLTGDPEASVSARIRRRSTVYAPNRFFRKSRIGGKSGVWEYRLSKPVTGM